jgi:MSHA pilin protein MshD
MSTKSRGFTLVEMIVAIVIISVAITGVLIIFSNSVRGSSNPLVHKQMLATAEEVIEEILLKPYPSAPAIPSGAGAQNCGAGASRNAFADVGSYNGYQTTGICATDGSAVAGLTDYNLRVTAAYENWQALGATNSVRVTVVVTHATDNESMQLVSWRTRP